MDNKVTLKKTDEHNFKFLSSVVTKVYDVLGDMMFNFQENATCFIVSKNKTL